MVHSTCMMQVLSGKDAEIERLDGTVNALREMMAEKDAVSSCIHTYPYGISPDASARGQLMHLHENFASA